MPTYEYQCRDCQYRVDYFQSIKEEARTECPRCKGRLERMVSRGGGLIFKGTGFYETDYKKHSTGNDNGHHHSTVTKKETTTATADKPVVED